VKTHHQRSFPFDSVDPHGLDIVQTLQEEGFVAYFVGGCVRDLLLGRTPKDFDIATEATPDELSDVFGRRCRIIGRRFRLGHVRAGSNIYEVATFRGTPEEQEADDESGFVVRANTFGTPEEDARSRDFTCNGLFYDPVQHTLIDYVGGMADIERGKIVTIGDARERFIEDPVRLLRAIRFAAKLGLELDAGIVDVGTEVAPLIDQCPTARVSEELFRIFESGHSRPAAALMAELGVFEHLIPELDEVYQEDSERVLAWLDELDGLTKAHGTLPRPSTFCLVAWPVLERCLRDREFSRSDWGTQLFEDIRQVSIRLNIPTRHRHRLRGLLNLHGRMLTPSRRKRSLGNQLRSPSLPLALTVTRLRWRLEQTVEGELEVYERWSQQIHAEGIWAAPFEPRSDEDSDEGRPGSRGRTRTRRPRNRKPKQRSEGAGR